MSTPYENAPAHATEASQLRRGGVYAVWACVVIAVLILGLAATLKLWLDVPIRWMTRDPVALLDYENPFIGAISHAGVLFWAAAAAVARFSAALFRSRSQPALAACYLQGAALSALLLFDDLFMLHERVLPALLGVPEAAIYAVYACAAGAYLIRCRAVLLAAPHGALAAALGFFAFSMAADFLGDFPGQTFLEDGSKLLGVACWCAFFIRSALHWLAHDAAAGPSRAADSAITADCVRSSG